jgi:hypothetical protein
MVFRNDNAGSTVAVDTGIAKDSATHTVEIIATEAGTPQFAVLIDGVAASGSPYTTEIPLNTTKLSTHCSLENATTAAAAKDIDVWYLYADQDP